MNVDVLRSDLLKVEGSPDAPGSGALCEGIEFVHNGIPNISYLLSDIKR